MRLRPFEYEVGRIKLNATWVFLDVLACAKQQHIIDFQLSDVDVLRAQI